MSQARVTDFYALKKKGISGGVKPVRTRSGAARHKDAVNTSVHEEFLRVIDEAVGLEEGHNLSDNTAKHFPSSPRTPKRTSSSVDTQFDLGAALFSATADHSTAKKRRQAEEAKPEKTVRRRARKKLELAENVSKAGAQSRPPLPPPGEVTQEPTAPAARPRYEQKARKHENLSSRRTLSQSSRNGGQASKALSKEDIAALKCRLQKIKKCTEETTHTASAPSSSYVGPPIDLAPKHPEAKTTTSITRATELAAKVQRRNEKEAEESRQSNTQPPESVQQPAYQLYHNLAQAAPPSLSLPYQYKVLAEMFRNMDTVVAMLYNRCETATFTKIKQGVQDLMHKRFEENHMGQIKTVFPEAYTFRQEKNIPTFNSSIKKSSYQLTVEPVITSDQNEGRPALSASLLLQRRHTFHSNLASIVKQHHKVFLSSLVPPMSVPDDKLTRWHPKFNVDTMPAIQGSPLPQPPLTEKLSTAQEVLDRARSLMTPKMEKALVSMALKTEDKAAESKESTVPETPTATPGKVATSLKGVSQSLLERIRAKEAQKLQAAMTRNPEQEERLLMMSRLPELARILRNVFVAEKKAALIMEVACNRMVASYRSALSTGEMEKHIRLLAEVDASWLTIHPIRKDFYLKLNKNVELNIVVEKLSRRLKEEQGS